jgi:type II secretory pathway component PulM
MIHELWARLEGRNRRALVLGGLALIALACHQWIWVPTQRSIAELNAINAEQRNVLAWMQEAKSEIDRLRNQAGAEPGTEASLMAVVDGALRKQGFDRNLRKLEPDTGGGVRLSLEQIGFDELVAWITSLQLEQGVMVARFAAVRAGDGNGQVNVNLTLAGRGG